MSTLKALTSSTLKPIPDKWVARDGRDVVLDFSADELIILSYAPGGWKVCRHHATAGSPSAVQLRWAGTDYLACGAPVASITEEDPPEKWKNLYRELLSVSA